ncbi:MAG: HD domain-containing protein [Deltaproteobacteria bacterium]|nr:HD domain-containing protein [Deltaproteobacteria bacterium]
MHLNTLRPDQIISFDIHVKVDNRHVVYRHRDEKIEGEKIKAMLAKQIKKVFITESDEENYLSYLDAGLGDLAKTDVAVADKANLAKDTLSTHAANIERNLETEKAYNRSTDQLAKVIDFFATENKALKHVLANAGLATDNTEHSSNVASYALGLATLAGIKKPETLLELGIAALVHDLGSTKLGLDPLLPREKMKGDTLKRYLGHTTEGAAVLSGKPFITSRILALVADHEELGEGRGYPEKKNIANLSRSSQILNLCNAFDKYCMVSKQPVFTALDEFIGKNGEFFPTDLLTLLVTVVTAK